MARHFEASPVSLKPPVTETLDVRRSDDENPRPRTKSLAALAQQSLGVGHMFDHMAEGDDVVSVRGGNIRDRAAEGFHALAPGSGHRSRIGIDSGHPPAERLHLRD